MKTKVLPYLKKISRGIKLLSLASVIMLPFTVFSQSKTYTSSSTFTVPANITTVKVECWGGGGRGGTMTANGGGGGAGGGAYASSIITVVPENTYTITVGTGSSSNTAPGGDSWFGTSTTILAKGGNSVANNATTGALGGNAASCIGDIIYSGGTGADGSGTTYGGGGGSSAGIASNGTTATNATGAVAPLGGANGGAGKSGTQGTGTAGSYHGGGGGGALRTSSSTRNGGNGATGMVLVTWSVDAISTFPFSENFDGVTAPAMPDNWSVANNNGDAYPWQTSSLGPNSSPNSMYIRYNSSLAMNDWFFSPPVYLTGGTSYKVAFYYMNDGGTSYPEKMEVKFGTSAAWYAMDATPIFSNSNITGGYQLGSGTFIPGANGNYYFGWHGFSAADEDVLLVDDITIQEVVNDDVASVALINPTMIPESQQMPWFGKVLNNGLNTETFDVATILRENSILATTTTNNITNLSSGTSAVLSGNFDLSSLGTASTFDLSMETQLSGDENISNDLLTNYTRACTRGTIYAWDDGEAEGSVGFNTSSGWMGQLYYFSSSVSLSSCQIEWGTIPGPLSGTSLEIYNVSGGIPTTKFADIFTGISLTAADVGVWKTYFPTSPVSLPAGTYWIGIHQSVILSGTYIVSNDQTGFSASNFLPGQCFYSTTGTTWTDYVNSGLYMFNMIRPDFATCIVPIALPASNITSTSADLSWTSPASLFNVKYNAGSNFNPDIAGTSVSPDPTSTSCSLIGLSGSTTYYWYVRANCGGGDLSSWSGPNTFTTTCNPFGAFTEDFETTNFPPTCWSLANSAGPYTRSTAASSYGVGSASVYANFYLITAGNTLDIITPTLDLTGIADPYIVFDHAYATFSTEVDYLEIWTSSNDGMSYTLLQTILGGPSGPLNTGGVTSSSFVPTASQWATKAYSIPTNTNKVMFRGVSAYGNNMYLDKISLQNGPLIPGLWTGVANTVWNNAGNWDDGQIPTAITDVTIPAGLTNYPTLTIAGSCNNIFLSSTSAGTATLMDNGNLTVNGTATVQRYYPTGAPTFDEWHLISSPISNGQAGIYTSYYLQWFEEGLGLGTWHDIINTTDLMNPLQGYALYVPSNGMTFNYVGNLNTGIVTIPVSAHGLDPLHWNLLGNPYPSSLDWDLVQQVNMGIMWTGAVYYLDQATGAYLSYNAGMGSGSRYVPPEQGFFVAINADPNVFTVNNSMRTHQGGSNYYKSDFDNLLVLEATGNNFSDATYLRFDASATPEIDKEFDAFKLFTATNSYLPQLYTFGGGDKLSINVLPETEMVPAGFKAGVAGEYTIGIKEVTGMSNVVLEDLITGIQTDLLTNAYIFYYNLNDPENRFIIHFTPLAVAENNASLTNIFAYGHNVYVYVPAGTQGTIMLYNLMGQEVTSTPISGHTNIITLANSAYYVVRVLSSESVVSKKVFIK